MTGVLTLWKGCLNLKAFERGNRIIPRDGKVKVKAGMFKETVRKIYHSKDISFEIDLK